jgi:transcriptional antiterminator Rof (Rho-off)
VIRSRHRDLIHLSTSRYNLSPILVEALVLKESGDDPWAFNPEPTYRYLWDARHSRPFRSLSSYELSLKTTPPDFYDLVGNRGAWADHEWLGQQASWGLAQIMGAVARERGFTGHYLTQLCDPQVNLELACQHLRILLDWAEGDLWKAAAAYNGGRGGWRGGVPQEYATQVRYLYNQVMEDERAPRLES